MVTVIFEFYPESPAAEEEYLKTAAELRPLVDQIDGFVSVERFRGLTSEGKLLSISSSR